MTTATTSLIRLERHPNGVAEVVLDRPEAMNAVSTAMATALREVGETLRADVSVRAVVLTSSHPRAFCVGADLKERNGLSDDELRAQRPGNRVAYRALLDLPVPTVAAVGGFAMGGGCELALTCDLIVAGEGAVFALPEVSVGVIPGAGGTQLLARRVGWSRAADVVFTARRLDAAEAYRIGLADRLVTDAREAALELAATIAGHSPVGVRNAKAAMRVGLDLPLDEGLDVEDARWHDTAFSADRAEGVRAFAEKRPPQWPGLG
ncbi:enoyl-CoA hydratase/isomerase family protein [Knoellia subterranea]|uniref:enoyl-CoA hydratase n=1 Tax=Knoellia subterranea KCTC 19937 TaxID=1385521 RepID=A0A0A0JQC7_9MICO|nr:enoyl-CoA hydratase-related protein [Knoellia subterranea]KGN39373.1 enoyl-CoA hydratase [Knoellia subterranea KCTC 19937]